MTDPRRLSLKSLALAPLLLAAAGCCPIECEPEGLPHRGHATTTDELAEIVRHEAKFECWSALYDLLSQKTRDKHGRTEWRLFASSIRIPAPYDYRVVDVVEKGIYVASLPDPRNPDEAIAIYDYQEPGKRKLAAHVLLRRELPEGDRDKSVPEWRIALEDQVARIERGDRRYWWFEDP